MGKEVAKLMLRMGSHEIAPPFRKAPVIRAKGLELRPKDKYYYTETQVPCYEFLILVDGEEAGTFRVRIESDFEKVREIGNVGIEIKRKFHGHDLPSKATKAVLPFFRKHGMNSILITCDKGKRAIRKACDQLSARYLDTINTSVLEVERERFVLDF